METFGARLKKAREAQGMSLKDIAARTKIAVATLEVLERNDLTRLPGGIFSRAMVRSYAVEIGLDPDRTVEEFLTRLEESEREAAARRAAARPAVTADDKQFLERQRRAMYILRIVVILLAAVSVGLLVWQVRRLWFSSASAPASAPAPVAAPAPPPPPASNAASDTEGREPDPTPVIEPQNPPTVNVEPVSVEPGNAGSEALPAGQPTPNREP